MSNSTDLAILPRVLLFVNCHEAKINFDITRNKYQKFSANFGEVDTCFRIKKYWSSYSSDVSNIYQLIITDMKHFSIFTCIGLIRKNTKILAEIVLEFF